MVAHPAESTCLVLMLKAPERSKRRLAQRIGSRSIEAAELLGACAMEDLLAWPGATCCAPASIEDLEWLRERAPPGAHRVLQSGRSLGARIGHVSEALHRAGLPRQLFIGIDCPALDREYLSSAAETLVSHDAVLAPAHDGGVVLMGARRPWPSLDDLPWSTSSLHRTLRERCAQAGFSVATLEPRADIDTLDDLLSLEEALLNDARPARRALVQWLVRSRKELQ